MGWSVMVILGNLFELRFGGRRGIAGCRTDSVAIERGSESKESQNVWTISEREYRTIDEEEFWVLRGGKSMHMEESR